MFWTVTLSLLQGFGSTLKIFALTLLFSLPLGLIISFGSMSKFKPLKAICNFIVWVVRGTPLMLQLIVIYYGPGLIANFFTKYIAQTGSTNGFILWMASIAGFERFTAVMVAFVINYSCYFSVIYRGGIESIPVGQYEAGQVLGMTKRQTFSKVILLQVIKRVIPPMSNEIITLVKDTSLARMISVYEIIWNGQAFIKSDGLLWPLLYTGAFYLIFCGLLTIIFGRIEKRLDYFHG